MSSASNERVGQLQDTPSRTSANHTASIIPQAARPASTPSPKTSERNNAIASPQIQSEFLSAGNPLTAILSKNSSPASSITSSPVRVAQILTPTPARSSHHFSSAVSSSSEGSKRVVRYSTRNSASSLEIDSDDGAFGDEDSEAEAVSSRFPRHRKVENPPRGDRAGPQISQNRVAASAASHKHTKSPSSARHMEDPPNVAPSEHQSQRASLNSPQLPRDPAPGSPGLSRPEGHIRSILKAPKAGSGVMSLDLSDTRISATWAAIASSDTRISFFVLGYLHSEGTSAQHDPVRSSTISAVSTASTQSTVTLRPGVPQPMIVVAEGTYTGVKGLRSIQEHLIPSEARFAILRVMDKYLLVQCLGEGLSGVRRARALVHGRSLMAHFPTLTATTVVSKAVELTDFLIRFKLKLNADTPLRPLRIHRGETDDEWEETDAESVSVMQGPIHDTNGGHQSPALASSSASSPDLDDGPRDGHESRESRYDSSRYSRDTDASTPSTRDIATPSSLGGDINGFPLPPECNGLERKLAGDETEDGRATKMSTASQSTTGSTILGLGMSSLAKGYLSARTSVATQRMRDLAPTPITEEGSSYDDRRSSVATELPISSQIPPRERELPPLPLDEPDETDAYGGIGADGSATPRVNTLTLGSTEARLLEQIVSPEPGDDAEERDRLEREKQDFLSWQHEQAERIEAKEKARAKRRERERIKRDEKKREQVMSKLKREQESWAGGDVSDTPNGHSNPRHDTPNSGRHRRVDSRQSGSESQSGRSAHTQSELRGDSRISNNKSSGDESSDHRRRNVLSPLGAPPNLALPPTPRTPALVRSPRSPPPLSPLPRTPREIAAAHRLSEGLTSPKRASFPEARSPPLGPATLPSHEAPPKLASSRPVSARMSEGPSRADVRSPEFRLPILTAGWTCTPEAEFPVDEIAHDERAQSSSSTDSPSVATGLTASAVDRSRSNSLLASSSSHHHGAGPSWPYRSRNPTWSGSTLNTAPTSIATSPRRPLLNLGSAGEARIGRHSRNGSKDDAARDGAVLSPTAAVTTTPELTGMIRKKNLPPLPKSSSGSENESSPEEKTLSAEARQRARMADQAALAAQAQIEIARAEQRRLAFEISESERRNRERSEAEVLIRAKWAKEQASRNQLDAYERSKLESEERRRRAHVAEQKRKEAEAAERAREDQRRQEIEMQEALEHSARKKRDAQAREAKLVADADAARKRGEAAAIRKAVKQRDREMLAKEFLRLQAAGDMVLEGDLSVQIGDATGWKRRWFALKDGEIAFFKTSHDAQRNTPTEHYNLRGAIASIEDAFEEAQMPHSFRVNFTSESGSECFVAYTDTEDDMEVLLVGMQTLSKQLA
ncbi:MAX-1A [Ceraceosorus bombacis]|uniref:MAX-1A n=1 Tax=Ceraceosorus bombacis TaxID=401625 RepID=A0A0P1BQR8_9BASI|nr:MAX-1A [Ceraceosorus bombacis]